MSLHKYKIHGVESVLGTSRSTNNGTFYNTYEEAKDAARRCVTKDGCEIVIFEAIKIVRAETPPIIIEDIT